MQKNKILSLKFLFFGYIITDHRVAIKLIFLELKNHWQIKKTKLNSKLKKHN
jgi:hypothetical protein